MVMVVAFLFTASLALIAGWVFSLSKPQREVVAVRAIASSRATHPDD